MLIRVEYAISTFYEKEKKKFDRSNRSRSAPAAMTAVFKASTRVWNGGTWRYMTETKLVFGQTDRQPLLSKI